MVLHTNHIRVDPAYRDVLRAVDLFRVDSVLARTSGRVSAWSRSTDTLRVSGPERNRPGFYVKRYYYPDWSKRLRGAFRGTFFGYHRGLAEFRLLNEMRSLGIPAVRPVAHGSRRIGHFIQACFLITEEAPGTRNLTTFACDVRAGRTKLSAAQRDLIVRKFARQIAELHAASFAHGQLFWRNVLIRFSPIGEPEFFFLDARPRRGGRKLTSAGRWWVRELAHVLASAVPFTSQSERLRFLHEYYGARQLSPDIKGQIREIDRLARRWTKHERQRIKMNDLFDEWNRRLEFEQTGVMAPDGFMGAAP